MHSDVPVYDGTLSHSLEVRQQRLLIRSRCVYVNLPLLNPQAKWHGLQRASGAAGRGHITSGHVTGGCLAHASCYHLLRGGSRNRYSAFAPARDIAHQTARVHRRH